MTFTTSSVLRTVTLIPPQCNNLTVNTHETTLHTTLSPAVQLGTLFRGVKLTSIDLLFKRRLNGKRLFSAAHAVIFFFLLTLCTVPLLLSLLLLLLMLLLLQLLLCCCYCCWAAAAATSTKPKSEHTFLQLSYSNPQPLSEVAALGDLGMALF